MRPFWRSFFASSLAMIVTGGILLIIFFAILGSFFSFLDEPKPFKVENDSVLHIQFDEAISEKSYAEFNKSSFEFKKAMGLREIKIGLEAAKTDDHIKGIYINLTSVPAGMASIEEIRNALIDFKESGKFVIAYSEMYTQQAYYISTVADKIYLYPEGVVEFRGLGGSLMFLKGAIDKLGIDMQIIRGSNNKFKSAVEPLMYDSMSAANREQTMTYLNALWGQMLKGIEETRGVSIKDLNEMADSLYVRNGETALQYKLIDALIYEDELTDELKAAAGTEELNLVSFRKYCIKQANKLDGRTKEKDKNIAIVYAVGGIESGKGNATTIGSETIAGAIRDARKNENIKAIVLRVNSPGGSALASDVIWREVILAKEVKPVIVSMGDVAASGGYYISCAADRIFAQPNTITGSIGVFGVIPNFGPALKKNFGITFDQVKTNEHAVVGVTSALSDEEKKIIQEGVDDIYNDFTSKVADGREMTQAEVDSIGQGRVWAGTDALRIGLVDELGGIDAAVAYAAEQANIASEDVSIHVYPESKKDELLKFIEKMDLQEGEDREAMLKAKLAEFIKTVERVTQMKDVQARMPFEIIIE